MKTLKEIEKEFEECAQSIMSEKEIEQFYRQAIAEILEEVVNCETKCDFEPKEIPKHRATSGLIWRQAQTGLKAEIRERIKSILE